MNILLLSMPDSFEHTPALTMRMPNGALASLAGNLDRHHHVAVADLILVQDRVADTVTRLVGDHNPGVVGLSVMTFQRRTALRLIRLIRRLRPETVIVAGGYDASLAPEAYEPPELGIDYLVRGEGELTFRALVRALEHGQPLDAIAGLSYRSDGGAGSVFVHNPARDVSRLNDREVALPNRAARVLSGYTFLGRPIDIVETSRGCTYDCSFCSIIEMRGRNFHTFDFSRVLADIADARARGARAIFIVDDNVTLNVARFEALCGAIVDAGLNDVHYLVQAMTSSIASHGDTLAPMMRKAGFRYVFLGIENVLDEDLEFLRASAKNAQREHGRRTGNATMRAIDFLHRAGIYVVGGIIVGNPGDTRASIQANLDFARQYVDWPYIQHPTPYPGTPMTADFRRQHLIVSEQLEEYDGTTAVVRTAHLDCEEIEFMRWREERWMKLRHLPAALRAYPGFVLRHAPQMLAHTFRGSTWRSVLGLENERTVFRRYKERRRREREYLPEVEERTETPARGRTPRQGAA
ncbi:MAG: B12-binding domain-containing radical SAM protein [Acidobacteria bacterium]|nr:MAG: B12-binding domain-containing radical SAM protein [Acidobacteriota bacterium]